MSSIEELNSEIPRINSMKNGLSKNKIDPIGLGTVDKSNSNVELSSLGRLISEKMYSTPEISKERLQKLEDLKEKIQSGNYHIDDTKIDAIVEHILTGENNVLGLGLFD